MKKIKEDKADDLIKNNNVRLDIKTENRIHFTVNSNEEHSLYFDRKNITWNCDCRYFSIKEKQCSHILAAKHFWESKIKNKCEKELDRVRFALKELKPLKEDKNGKNLLHLIKSYSEDAHYFFDKKEYLECFELCSYIFGLLDSAARLGYIDPGAARKHYKIDQNE